MSSHLLRPLLYIHCIRILSVTFIFRGSACAGAGACAGAVPFFLGCAQATRSQAKNAGSYTEAGGGDCVRGVCGLHPQPLSNGRTGCTFRKEQGRCEVVIGRGTRDVKKA